MEFQAFLRIFFRWILFLYRIRPIRLVVPKDTLADRTPRVLQAQPIPYPSDARDLPLLESGNPRFVCLSERTETRLLFGTTTPNEERSLSSPTLKGSGFFAQLDKITIVLLLTCAVAQAQQILTPDANTRVCGATELQPIPRYRTAPPGPNPERIIKNVCKLMGVSSLNFTILATENVDNAVALISGGTRYILYRPKFISDMDPNKYTYYPHLAILAHEIGHHVNGHTLQTCQSTGCQQGELEADKFAGCALLRAEAAESDLNSATVWMSPNGNAEHPPRAVRQQKVLEGYQECIGKEKPCTKNQTGEIVFRNKTGKAIEILLDRDYNIRTTIEPNETGMLTTFAGANRFKIRRESALWHDQNNPTRGTMMQYKDVTYSVMQCAENPPPIDIR